MGQLADILQSKGGYNETDALNAEKGPRAAELAREFGVSLETSNLSGDIDEALYNGVLETINGLYDKLNATGVPSLTDAELENFLNKAIEQITPYYDKKKSELEAGVKEDKIRSMEDILVNVRDVAQTTQELLAKYDVEQAETEEDLVNKLADITATKEEDLAMKADDWRGRIEQQKTAQIQGGTLTSGVGQKRVQDLLARQSMEQQAVARRAGTAETVAQTGAKYDLERVALARQNAEAERVRRIGTPAQQAELEEKALGELGYTDMGQLPSEAELLRARTERGITPAKPESLSDLEEERKRATESRKLQLQSEELAARTAKEQAQRQSILAEISKNQNKLSTFSY